MDSVNSLRAAIAARANDPSNPTKQPMDHKSALSECQFVTGNGSATVTDDTLASRVGRGFIVERREPLPSGRERVTLRGFLP
jgi:hypothetical protein